MSGSNSLISGVFLCPDTSQNGTPTSNLQPNTISNYSFLSVNRSDSSLFVFCRGTHQHQKCSNFLCVQSYALRFSDMVSVSKFVHFRGLLCPDSSQEGVFTSMTNTVIFSTLGQKWRWIPPPEMNPDTKNTPEMNELEIDKTFLKI